MQALLKDIAETKIHLAPSPIHGIGVFALVDLPVGTTGLFSPPADWPAVPLAELEILPAHTRRMLETYCLRDETHIYLPPHGLRLIDLVMFLNHAEEPNLRQLHAGDDFITLRAIKAGEELLLDYGSLEV